MKIQKLKKSSCFTFLIILLLSLTFNTFAIKAQVEDTIQIEDEFVDEENGKFYGDEEEFYGDEEEFYGDEDEFYDEGGSDIYENVVDLEDPDGMYKLDDLTASTFQKITSMERDNSLMKLQIEQEKLKLDLEKQRIEKKKLALNLADEEKTRTFRREEQERKAEEARRKDREIEEIEAQKEAKRLRDEELSKKIMEKLNSADLTDPDEIDALNRLLVFAGGSAAVTPLQTRRSRSVNEVKEEVKLEDKYIIRSIIGAGGKLVANIENVEKKSTFKVRIGSLIDGWMVESIKNSNILLKRGGIAKVMYLN